MPDTTNKLDLPLILPAQAQKHVTHNEALQIIDTIIQMSALSRQRSAPPPSAADGDTYLVASSASGAWAGHDHAVATWQNSAWQFLPPLTGWQCWVVDEQAYAKFDGTSWSDVAPVLPDMVPQWGVGTSADVQNPLSVSGPGALFNHSGSDHRVTVNKAASGDTASIVFQQAYSGRAEIGLMGNDSFQLKVSNDGNTFTSAIEVDSLSGKVAFPNGGGGPNIAQLRNSDTTTDINTGIATDIPINGITDMIDAGWFTSSGAGVMALRAGRVRVSVNLHVYSDALRPNLNVGIAVNGIALPGYAATGYIRSMTYHNESSFSISRYVDVSPNDVITVQAQKEAGDGVVTMTNGNSILLLEQW